MSQEQMTIWLLSQQSLWREGIRQAFLSTKGIEVIEEAEVIDNMPLTNIGDIVLTSNTNNAQFFKALKCIHS